MTTKHISGYYPGGYALSPNYRKLVIDGTADVRGDGVQTTDFATVVNDGSVYGSDRGVYLEAGGSVINGSSKNVGASIAGYDIGVKTLGNASVTNFGMITAAVSYGAGVVLGGDGSLTNGSVRDTTAMISGYAAVLTNTNATVANFGTIEGTAGYSDGVLMREGGTLANGSVQDNTALIRGGFGVSASGAAGTIANFGTIEATGNYDNAVQLNAGGSVTNGSVHDSSALISGSFGVTAFGYATIINFGTIEGGSYGVSVRLESAGADVIAEAGSTFIGTIKGYAGRLTLAGGGTGTISGLGGAGTLTGAVSAVFSGFGSYEIAAGGAWTLTGSNTLHASSILSDNGTLVNRGALTLSGTVSVAAPAVFRLASGDITAGLAGDAEIVDYGLMVKGPGTGEITIGAHMIDRGVVEVATGTLDFTSRLFGTGVLKIDAGATLEADAGAASTLTATFVGESATLALGTPRSFDATLSGFAAGDIIDLLAIAATEASVNDSDQLAIVDGSKTVATLQLSGNYVGVAFTTEADGRGGTNIELAPAEGVGRASVHGMAAAISAFVVPTGAAALGQGHDLPTDRASMLMNPHVHLQ